MPISTQTASEEDIVSTRLLNPEDIATYITQSINATHLEWFAAILLDPQQYLLDNRPYLLYLGTRCPVMRFVNTEEFLAEVKRSGTHSIITARYHPHPPRIFTDEDYDRFYEFRHKSKSHGVAWRNHLTLDSTGGILSWRDWGQGKVPGSGSSKTVDAPR